jgi:coenzyme F420-reducing hydrogenase alpha subunit
MKERKKKTKTGSKAKSAGTTRNRRIKVDYLARVEGEGAMYVKIKDNQVKDVQFKIFEPPRFYEAFLRGRRYTEPPDITARICGICPVAYQMSSVHAVEMACGVTVGGPIRELRRLIYCGEWIESHVLHTYMLHTPDFLGYESALHIAKDLPDVVKKALELKKIGNELVTLIGGREIHPVNVRVGGFYRAPKRRDLLKFRERLEWARDASIDTIKLFATFDFPDFDQDYEYVSVCHPDEYPFNEGRLKSNKGLDIGIGDFNHHFEEIHAERSNALQVRLRRGGAYHVGPLARYNLNYDLLTPTCKEMASVAGLGTTCSNPFKSLIVRGVETLYAVEEAMRVIDDYEEPDKPYVEVEPRAGTGHGATEAPRGTLYHQYAIDGDGNILTAQIVPPTAQNQLIIERDMYRYVEKYMDLPDDKLQWRLEQSIRNYDPCISCATHFLELKVDRE